MKIILASLFLFAQIISNNDAKIIDELGEWTDYDEPVFEVCKNGGALSRIESQYSKGAKDRKWRYTCKYDSKITSNCYWTDWLNDYDQEIIFQCSYGVITGVDSVHNNGAEDRIFKFKCCHTTKSCQYNCHWTDYVNDWRDDMDYQVPSNSFLTGVKSYHKNKEEDRKWQYLECQQE